MGPPLTPPAVGLSRQHGGANHRLGSPETIKSTTYACSKDELKPTLNGVLISFGTTSVTSVSTDGHRLVKFICKQENETGSSVLIPQKFLNIIGTGAINTKKDLLIRAF